MAERYLELNIRIFIKRDEAAKNPKRSLRQLSGELEEIAREAIYDPESARTKIKLLVGVAKPKDIDLIFKG